MCAPFCHSLFTALSFLSRKSKKLYESQFLILVSTLLFVSADCITNDAIFWSITAPADSFGPSWPSVPADKNDNSCLENISKFSVYVLSAKSVACWFRPPIPFPVTFMVGSPATINRIWGFFESDFGWKDNLRNSSANMSDLRAVLKNGFAVWNSEGRLSLLSSPEAKKLCKLRRTRKNFRL